MTNEKVFQMNFGKVYDLLLKKAMKKGCTKAEVDQVITWQTGYSAEEIEASRTSCYGDFFRKAPRPNPARLRVTGVICRVRVEEIEDPVMRDIRCLDKLIGELEKGKAMEKILRE